MFLEVNWNLCCRPCQKNEEVRMASSVAGIITNDKDGEARKSLDNERENHKVYH